MSYSQQVFDDLSARYAYQPEFLQAVQEVLSTLQPALDKNPAYQKNKILRQGRDPSQPWLPRPVQLRHWPIQGRFTFPPNR